MLASSSLTPKRTLSIPALPFHSCIIWVGTLKARRCAAQCCLITAFDARASDLAIKVPPQGEVPSRALFRSHLVNRPPDSWPQSLAKPGSLSRSSPRAHPTGTHHVSHVPRAHTPHRRTETLRSTIGTWSQGTCIEHRWTCALRRNEGAWDANGGERSRVAGLCGGGQD